MREQSMFVTLLIKVFDVELSIVSGRKLSSQFNLRIELIFVSCFLRSYLVLYRKFCPFLAWKEARQRNSAWLFASLRERIQIFGAEESATR